MKNPIIDVRDGETEDAARERHELATARAAIAHVDRVLENGRERAEFERLRAEVDCGQEGVCAKPPGCARHWQERNQELVAERDAALAEVASLREENARLASGGRRGAQIVEKLQSERAAALSASRAALSASRAWCERAAELQAELDCAVARAKDLEAALENAMGTFLGIYNSCVVSLDGPGPHALSNSIRPRAMAAACKLGEALHPPPPASASDRTGTEHHDAADPEDGCQAGARRP